MGIMNQLNIAGLLKDNELKANRIQAMERLLEVYRIQQDLRLYSEDKADNRVVIQAEKEYSNYLNNEKEKQ